MATPPSSTPNINVPIRIEPTDEYRIQEITYDGQEKYIAPPTMSEHLSQLIAKIDFNQPIEELKEELERPVDAEEDETTRPRPQLPAFSWPFESMRTKLRTALTEICVLIDVLAIAKEKKYMVFDAVAPKPIDQRPIVNLLAKKRALQNAAQVLIDGSATLRATNKASEPNFYDELSEMRKQWRLRRKGAIYGDLSYYRPMGYRATPSTRFEVIKTLPGSRGPSNQALAVKVPSELEGKAHIQVSIIKDSDMTLIDLSAASNGRTYEAAREANTWQEKLSCAQNVLFCKELFRQLANQAVQYQFVIPTTVTGNQIILALFPDVKLYITLVHKSPNTKVTRKMTEGIKKLEEEHRYVFEHSLHQMLRDSYATLFRRMQGRDLPREVGPLAVEKQSVLEYQRQESLLDRIVQQAQHFVLRQQTMDVIDSFAACVKDPLIISHWLCLNSPVTSLVRVDIVSQDNEALGRSHLSIHIGTRNLRVITRDCKNLLLGYEPDELRHLLLWQSCLHQFIASDKLCKLLGWYTLILNHNINVVRQERTSNAFSLVVLSPNCSHIISIKSGTQFGLKVDVAQFKDFDSAVGTPTNGVQKSLANGFSMANSASIDDDVSIEALMSSNLNGKTASETELCKLRDMVDEFREVDWTLMHGKDFLSKLELLLAALTEIA